MTLPQPRLDLEADLTNPGQFLACCGLLELAGHVDQEAVGWFDGTGFRLSYDGKEDLFEALLHCPCSPSDSHDDSEKDKSPPVKLGSPFDFVLDWWTEEGAIRAGFKTWAGGQTVVGFVDGMRRHVTEHVKDRQRPFGVLALRKPKPFYFDSRLSRLTSLDLGFSPDGFTTAFSPAVELLSLIGMQRFRPATVVEREWYSFATWREPLPVDIAAAVAAGLIPSLVDRRYEFPLVVRTGGKYKAFGPATLERSSHV